MTLTVDVTKTLGEFRLTADFVSAGRITALFGRSGTGKTTVINAVAGLPDAGRLMVDRRCSGWYLAVVEPGQIEIGAQITVRPGPRGMTVADAFFAKRFKHRR